MQGKVLRSGWTPQIGGKQSIRLLPPVVSYKGVQMTIVSSKRAIDTLSTKSGLPEHKRSTIPRPSRPRGRRLPGAKIRIDPYKGVSKSCEEEARSRSYENLRAKIAEDIVSLMDEHGLEDDEMRDKLNVAPGDLAIMVWDKDLTLSELNNILSLFSYEMVPIFRKRWPATHT